MPQAALPIPQDGTDAIAGLAGKWPQFAQEIRDNAPLWRDSLAVANNEWANFAADTLGWLEHSSSRLVASNIALQGADPHGAYKALLDKLERLLGEVSASAGKKGGLDTWHILRRPEPKSPAERLAQLIEEKKELDKTGRGRLRGMRDAMEMRDLARVAGAAFVDRLPGLEQIIIGQMDQHKQALASATSGEALLPAQQASRNLRSLERAKSALRSIEERLAFEFSQGATRGLQDLDDALHQEDMMHARIEGVMGQVSARIAGEQVGQVARLQSAQSSRIVPVSNPARPPSAHPPSGGFLSRVFNRSAQREGVWSSSARTLRLMKEKKVGAAQWPDVMALITDPGITPATPVGGVPLLQAFLEMQDRRFVNQRDLAALILMLSSADGDDTLRTKIQPSSLERYCFALAKVSIIDPQDDDWDGDGLDWGDEDMESIQAPEVVAQPLAALEIWRRARLASRRSLSANLYFARAVSECVAMQDADAKTYPWKDVVAEAMEKHPNENADTAMDNPAMRAFLEEMMRVLPDKQSAPMAFALLNHSLRAGSPRPSADLASMVPHLSDSQAEILAGEILAQHRTKPAWVGLFDTNPLPSIPQDEEDFLGFIPVSPSFLSEKDELSRLDRFRGEKVSALRDYHDMVSRRIHMDRWPVHLAQQAFAQPSLGLLHELMEARPDVPVGMEPTPGFTSNPLAMVMRLDFMGAQNLAGSKSKGHGGGNLLTLLRDGSTTDPVAWSQKLSTWMDASAVVSLDKDRPPGAVSFPRSTPLMLACRHNAHRWIGALLAQGADVEVRDTANKTAMDHWIDNMIGSASSTGPWRAENMLAAVSDMDKMGWWGVEELWQKHGDTIPVLAALLRLEVAGEQADPILAGKREEAIVSSIARHGGEQFAKACVAAHLAQGVPFSDAAFARVFYLANKAGISPELFSVEALEERADLAKAENSASELTSAMRKKMSLEKDMHSMLKHQMMQKMYSEERDAKITASRFAHRKYMHRSGICKK